MTIGVIGAMQMEMDNLKEAMTGVQVESVSGVNFMLGEIHGVKVVAAVSGIGKVFAAICTEAMILKYQPDMIINIGVAGSLTRDLGVLNVAVATKVCQHDMDTSAIGDPVGLLSGINEIFLPTDSRMVELLCSVIENRKIDYLKGTIASGDQSISRVEQRRFIRSHFEAIAAEMEGASIGHVCYMNKVPFAILRSISDSEGGAMDYQTFAEQAAVQSIEIVMDFLERIEEVK